MRNAEARPELPPIDQAADERTSLTEMLDYYRVVAERKVFGLDEGQLAATLAPSDLTLGGLILHLALVEDDWFNYRFAGNDEAEPWAGAPWDENPDWELSVAGEWSRDELLAQFRTSVSRSRGIASAASSLDQVAARANPDGSSCNLRWILVHLIEEYARHCGHADFLRQSVDGVTGD